MARPGSELLEIQVAVEELARGRGLTVPEICYELVDHRQLNEIAAYGGFPVRYPHWRFGMEYDRLVKGHRFGLQKIYELVVNTKPVVAYLLTQNSFLEQKLVMAHVCGHADFFAANAWFSHTDGNMMDVMASHGARIRSIMDRFGLDEVESFVDRVQSLDNLVDPGAMVLARGRPGNAPPLDTRAAERDVLGHVLLHGRLTGWQQEVLSMLRDEAYYFLPQMLTKIMNEGWASFWHSRLMTNELLRDAEIVDYADQHSGAMGGDEGPKNPYKLGIELFRWIVQTQGGETGGGLEAAFEARVIHNDVTFVDNFMTEEFCRQHGMGNTSEECAAAREETLGALTNGGQPVVRLVHGEGDRGEGEPGELLLEHCWCGTELQMEQAEETLRHLELLWGGPVRLATRLENRAVALDCRDAQVTREYGEQLEAVEKA